MKQKGNMALRIGAFVLTMAMLVMFSVGTIMMSLQGAKNVRNYEGERKIQFSSSGGYDVLEKFEFKDADVIYPGDKFSLDVDVKRMIVKKTGDVVDENYHASRYVLYAYNLETLETFVGEFDADGNPKSIATVSPGTYKISNLIVYFTYDNSTKEYYSNISAMRNDSKSTAENYKLLQKTFKISMKDPIADVPVYEYTIGFIETDPEVFVGDKIDIDLRRIDKFDEIQMGRKDLKTMMLSYTNEADGNVVNVFVKDILNSGKANIVVPSNATPGKYNLNFGYLTFVDDTTAKYMNTDTKTFSYNSSFVVIEKPVDTTKYAFNNVSFNDEVVSNLQILDNDAIITVDANALPVIDEEVFNHIKDTKRTLIIEYETSQWVFSGENIINPKSIDVSLLFTKLADDNDYYDEFLKENTTGPSAILQFADNGDLPGKVLIKIDKESVNTLLDDPEKVYVYYYKEDTDKLVKVAMEIQSNQNFYEFYINHNSKYILTTEEVNEAVVDEDLDMLSLNHQIVLQQSQQTPILYIIGTVLGGIAIILLIIRLTQRKDSQQQTQE